VEPFSCMANRTFSCAICFEERADWERASFPCCKAPRDSTLAYCRACSRSLKVQFRFLDDMGRERAKAIGSVYPMVACPTCRTWLVHASPPPTCNDGLITQQALLHAAARQRYMRNVIPNIVGYAVLQVWLLAWSILLSVACFGDQYLLPIKMLFVFVGSGELHLLALLLLTCSSHPKLEALRGILASCCGSGLDFTTEELAFLHLIGAPKAGFGRVVDMLLRQCQVLYDVLRDGLACAAVP